MRTYVASHIGVMRTPASSKRFCTALAETLRNTLLMMNQTIGSKGMAGPVGKPVFFSLRRVEYYGTQSRRI